MRPSNVGKYVKIELVDTTDEDLGVLYEKTEILASNKHADFFKTVAIRENGVIDLKEIAGTVDNGMWLKIS